MLYPNFLIIRLSSYNSHWNLHLKIFKAYSLKELVMDFPWINTLFMTLFNRMCLSLIAIEACLRLYAYHLDIVWILLIFHHYLFSISSVCKFILFCFGLMKMKSVWIWILCISIVVRGLFLIRSLKLSRILRYYGTFILLYIFHKYYFFLKRIGLPSSSYLPNLELLISHFGFYSLNK